MAVTVVDNGALTAGTSSAAPAFLATATAGDLLLIPCWSSADNNQAPDTPAGWNSLISRTGGTGTHGAGTGPRTVTIFTRIADGTEDLGETVTITNNGTGTTNRVTAGHILRLTKSLAEWNLAASSGSDASAGASLNVTADADPGGIAGDLILVVACYSLSSATLTTPSQVQNGLAWTGATLGSAAQLRNSATTQGSDLRQLDGHQTISSGTSSAAPSLALTTLSASVDGGPAVFVRIREQAASATRAPNTISQYMGYF